MFKSPENWDIVAGGEDMGMSSFITNYCRESGGERGFQGDG
jgi:hypothetical protein